MFVACSHKRLTSPKGASLGRWTASARQFKFFSKLSIECIEYPLLIWIARFGKHTMLYESNSNVLASFIRYSICDSLAFIVGQSRKRILNIERKITVQSFPSRGLWKGAKHRPRITRRSAVDRTATVHHAPTISAISDPAQVSDANIGLSADEINEYAPIT